MRILQLEKQRKMSGQTYRTLRVSAGLVRRGHHVSLVCRPDSQIADLAAEQGVRVFRMPMKGGGLYLSALRVGKLLRDEAFDVVHAHGSRDHQLSLLASFGASRPVVIRTKHNMLRLHSGVFSRFQYGTVTDEIITVSAAVRDILVDCGLPAEMISVVRSSIDTERWSPRPPSARVMREMGLQENDLVIGVAARLTSGSMDVPTLIDAFARIAPDYPEAKLLLAGRGGEAMREIASSLDIEDRVICPGFRTDMPEIYSVMDLFVQPSTKAALGTAVIEAMSMEKPAVGTPIGGIPEAIDDGVTGRLFPGMDAEAMAKTLVELLEDRESWEQMGQCGRERVKEHFDLEGMIKGVEDTYEKVIRRVWGGMMRKWAV